MLRSSGPRRSAMTRRSFLGVAAAAGGAALATGLTARAFGPRDVPPSGVQNRFTRHLAPRAGNPLRNPPELALTRQGRVVSGLLEARRSPVLIDNGPLAELSTYNGMYPGPLIRLSAGDVLELQLKNSLPHGGDNLLGHHRGPTNLHTHGLHVSPSGRADNVFLEIPPGGTFAYQFDTRHHRPGTTNWYHPHQHGIVAEQVWDGLAGALIVDDGDIAPSLAPYRAPGKTYTCVLKDISLTAGRPSPFTAHDFMAGKEGDIVTVNGQVHPVLSMRPGEVKRLRFINAGNARYYTLSLEGHGDPDAGDGFYIIGTDGGLLERPVRLSSPADPELFRPDGERLTQQRLSPFLTVGPGERVDLLLRASAAAGRYRLFSLPYDRGHEKQELVTLMTIDVAGVAVDEAIPAMVNLRPETIPADILANVGDLPVRKLELTMDMDMSHGSLAMSINGVRWHGHYPNETSHKITSAVGPRSYEVWEVTDSSTMDHPFHIHTNDFQVLDISCGNGEMDYAEFYRPDHLPGAWKDTLNIGKGSHTFKILVPVTDFGGDTVFHCHIAEHEDAGMMGRWIRVGGA